MRFWDSSAIVPLLVQQERTLAVRQQFDQDPGLIVWWATDVECLSAVTRLAREGRIAEEGVVGATERLAAVAASWQEVRPAARVRAVASRLLRTHPLRAGDALQLAAAIIVADDDPRSLTVVTLDDRLADAARREGFPVVIPGAT
jgi:predicted nucleic acid-binding protein